MVSSGPISLGGNATSGGLNQSVNIELGRSATASINMNESAVRTLFGVASGAISMSNGYGKSNRVAVSSTFSSNTANASLALSSIGGYVAGASDITITINGGVYLYATSIANAGLTLTGGTAGDTLTIVNNGYIMGMGGSGVNGGASVTNLVGNPGGTALSISINATINNTNASAYIGGGGGSGGGRYLSAYGVQSQGGAGGAGGGNAGNAYSYGSNAAGGAGGSIGSNGSNGSVNTGSNPPAISGGGGGRVFPSSTTTLSSNTTRLAGLGGSGGGTGGFNQTPTGCFSNGGGPGVAGSTTGSSGGSVAAAQGAGGGWGASGGTSEPGGGGIAGGAGGKAVALNGNSVTWTSGDTTRVYGAVS
jgi:hypothetical protein